MDLKFLDELNIKELREVGAFVGVKDPSNKRYDELKKEIEQVVNGETKPYMRKKSGRPRKRNITQEKWSRLFNDVYVEPKHEDFKLCFRQPQYNLFDNEFILKGFFRNTNLGPTFLAGEIRDLNFKDVYLFSDFVQGVEKLKNGDEIVCKLKYDYNNHNCKIIQIVKVNNCDFDGFVRPTPTNVLHTLGPAVNFTSSQLSFVNKITPIQLGQRVFIMEERNGGANYICNSIANDLSKKYNVVLISPYQKPEKLIKFNELVDNAFTTFTIDPNQQILIFESCLSRAVRLYEMGKDVFLIIQDIPSIMQAYKTIVQKEGLAYTIQNYENLFAGIKKILSLACVQSKGSLTLIMSGWFNDVDEEFNKITINTDTLCSNHIHLNKKDYLSNKECFYDTKKTYVDK